MKNTILNIIKTSIETKRSILLDDVLITTIEMVVEKMVNALQNKKRIYFCGNGGSAADAQHLAAELTGRFYKDRDALPAEALHCNTSYLTAVANDYSFDSIYQRLIKGIGMEGDVLIGLSTSGNSKNILLAFDEAIHKKMLTVGFTGADGGQLKALSQFWIGVPSNDTPRIQECHILIGHIICQLIEEKIF
ncbi:MAG: SIS domain-containing protein [Saprospiraceae bacterium]|nr:SIS domain-containing protein [Saprospiraceae bacterium]MBK8448968.1 SIS domain-containing protein [Saprospiraceae bacterium]MBK8484978.1 SIS domain-containing protein [Saprospiraceae bacterium]MBK9223212.1 SIS domain-containing protein [Saprospiraceae bacterium]MBK9720742.1 SIS domain-containing protein [Saprospiraceae bacterium]